MVEDRRLAAIMFTDMVGYTALTQADERHALEVLERHHRLLRPTFPRHRGREVKTMGDSFLVEFDSALEAVECALEIQRLLEEYNGSSSDAWRIRLRIGIHLGDVVHAEGDVLGDAVNVASRLEPLAEAGGVCVSEPVFGQVRNKVAVGFQKLEPRQLKGVRFPVEVYRVVVAGPEDAGVTARSPNRPRRLAVLPFANLSPDPQDEFFADGLTEEMIGELSRLPGLQVIARTSVMRFKGASKGVKEVGRELEADLALEGSVRKAANRLRIAAQLVDTSTEAHLWSERFDRDLTDIFAVQSEIARQVADRLGVSLGQGERSPVAPPGTLDAYFLYLKGRTLWNRRSEEELGLALKNFEAAVALDPSLAKAHSGIADCLLVMSWNLESAPWSEVGPRVKAEAKRAVELDEGLAEAHASLGLAYERDYAWADAERELRRAIELNEGYAPAHIWLSLLLGSLGRLEESEAELLRAARLDPLSPVVLLNQGGNLAYQGKLDAAFRSWDSAAELGPGFLESAMVYKVVSLVREGRSEEAWTVFRPFEERWTAEGPALEERITWMPGVTWALLGARDRAERSLSRLTELSKTTFVPERAIASVYAALGDTERFFDRLFRSVEDKSSDGMMIRIFPLYDPFRSDPRFAEALRRMGLPD